MWRSWGLSRTYCARATSHCFLLAGAHVLRVTEPDTRWLTGTFVYDGATGNRLLSAPPGRDRLRAPARARVRAMAGAGGGGTNT